MNSTANPATDLLLNDENNKTIAIFRRWEHVERIA